MIKISEIVNLKDGRRGRVVGQLQNGEYILSSGKCVIEIKLINNNYKTLLTSQVACDTINT